MEKDIRIRNFAPVDEIMENDITKENYSLMSLDKPLADIVMDDGGFIIEVSNLRNKESLPMSVRSQGTLRDWYMNRKIPASRKHLDKLYFKTSYSIEYLIKNGMALSLSDSFWIKPQDSDLTWKDVNYYTNSFSDDIGEYLVSGEGKIISFISPSTTTDGVYPKKWVIYDGCRILVKQGNVLDQRYDNLSEIMATKILSILTKNNNVSYTEYYPIGADCCGSLNFVEEGQNLVSAYRYLLSFFARLEDDILTKEHYEILSRPFGTGWLDTMIILDYIVFNNDRHPNNFGFIQDASTGDLLGPAPIFDTGSSLFFSNELKMTNDFKNRDFRSRTFSTHHNEQIKYADLTNFKSELQELKDFIAPALFDVYKETRLTEDQKEGMVRLLETRIEYLISQK